MLLNKRNLEIIKIAGADDARFALGSLYIDVKAKKTIVTDGHRLVTVSIPESVKDEDFPQVNGLTASPLIKSCLLPSEGIEKLVKALPKKAPLPILSQVAIDGVKTDADEKKAYLAVTDLESPQAFVLRKKDGTFPNYKEIFPKTEPTLRICVNAKYLVEILQLAQSYDARNCKVEIEVRGSDQPLVIRARDGETNQLLEALLMPLRSPGPGPISSPCEKVNPPVSGTTEMESGSEDLPEENGSQPSKQVREQPEDDLQDEAGSPMVAEEAQGEEGLPTECFGPPG